MIRLLDSSGERLEMAASCGLSRVYLEKGPVALSASQLDREALGGQAAGAGTVLRRRRPHAAVGEALVKIFDDGQRVPDREAFVHQHRHSAGGAESRHRLAEGRIRLEIETQFHLVESQAELAHHALGTAQPDAFAIAHLQ